MDTRNLRTYCYSSQKTNGVEVALGKVITQGGRVDGGGIAVTAVRFLLLILDFVSVDDIFDFVDLHGSSVQEEIKKIDCNAQSVSRQKYEDVKTEFGVK